MALDRVSSCRRAAASESVSGRIGGRLLLAVAVVCLKGCDDLVEIADDRPVHLGDAVVAVRFGGGDDLQGGLPLGMMLREELGGSHEQIGRASCRERV